MDSIATSTRQNIIEEEKNTRLQGRMLIDTDEKPLNIWVAE